MLGLENIDGNCFVKVPFGDVSLCGRYMAPENGFAVETKYALNGVETEYFLNGLQTKLLKPILLQFLLPYFGRMLESDSYKRCESGTNERCPCQSKALNTLSASSKSCTRSRGYIGTF
jgi:hypothetical protein